MTSRVRKMISAVAGQARMWRLEVIYRAAGIEGVAHALQNMRNPVPALHRWGAQIGDKTLIYPGITIHAAHGDFSNLHVGADVRIVRDCLLDLTDRITIEDKAIISMRCNLLTHQNIHLSPLAEWGYAPAHAPITIKSGAVLFSNVTVLMGVTIDECAMVASGAVVTEDVPAWTLVGGVPAKVIRSLKE